MAARSPLATLARLRAVRNAYGASAEREKRALLTALDDLRLATAAQVAALHEDLLFLCAFPGSPGTRRRARRLLDEIGKRVRRLPRLRRSALDDTGIAGSVTRHVFPFPVAHWLARTVASEVEIDWRHVDDASLLDGFVGALSRDAEREAFDGGDFATRDWIRLARRAGAQSDLQWLMEAAAALPALAPRLADAWDTAEVPVAWEIGESRWSVTHNMLAGAPIAWRMDMRRPPSEAVAQIARPLPAIERLPRPGARRVIASARAALAARCREVNAMTYPNVDEVWWCELGEGVALAVIGISPTLRLTLETNTGYLLFANGVPVGYGGVTPLFRQANTGINIFDPYRGGEAAFMWVEMLRAFHSLYGTRRFIVNAYQFGAGNAEAIRSGAFWFYYRLGFRPAQAPTRALAAREAQRMAADRKYRSDARTLKALATGDLYLDLPGFSAEDGFDEALLPQVGACAARKLARVSCWSRAEAERCVTARVAEELGIDNLAAWTAGERRGFAFLAPVVANVAGMGEWEPGEREAVVAMMRAKGAPQERGFALAARDAPRFFRALRGELRRHA